MDFKGFANQLYVKVKITYDEKGNKNLNFVNNWNKTAVEDVQADDKWNWSDSLAMIIPEGCVVVDSDTLEEGEIIIKCIKDQNLKCFISKSKKGYHFFFRVPKDSKMKSISDCSIPLGLVDIDYKTGTARACVIQYRDGVWDTWLEGYAPTLKKDPATGKEVYALDVYEDIDEIPFWLMPLKSNIISFRGLRDGDGRNNKLNSHRTKLVDQYGYTQEQVRELFELINAYVFQDPLPENELMKVSEFREIDRKSKDKRWFDEKGRFQHNLLGDYLAQLMYCYKDEEKRRVWYFNGKFYQPDDYVLEQKIVEIAPTLKTRDRTEVINHIHLVNMRGNALPEKQHSWVCCNNVLIEGATGNTMGHTPAVFVTNMINATYDPNAFDEDVNKFLNEVLVDKGDREQRLIFEEYLGYTVFAQGNFMKKMLLMIGENADNGKTTTCDMVRNFLGVTNCSTVKLHEIGDKNPFMLSKLVDKIANFDDEARTSLDDSNVTYLKSIISDGNEITVNQKYKEPFQTFIHAKMWANSNHIIITPQKGNEWMTRLLILSFNNIFTGKKDLRLPAKLSTPNARSYLLNLAIKGFQRLLANGQFTYSKESEKWTEQYRIENDNAFNYLFTNHYTLEQFVGKDMLLKTLWTDYKADCEDNNKKPMSLNNFGKRVVEYFKGKLKIELIDNNWVIQEVK